MKTLMFAAAAAVLAAALNLTPASAAQWKTSTTAGSPHWEWQYGYVGHHPAYRGHWVLVH